MRRGPEVPEERVPVVESLDGFARITSKELAPIHSVKNGTLQNACSARPRVVVGLGKSAHSHIVRLVNNPVAGQKKRRGTKKTETGQNKQPVVGTRKTQTGQKKTDIRDKIKKRQTGQKKKRHRDKKKKPNLGTKNDIGTKSNMELGTKNDIGVCVGVCVCVFVCVGVWEVSGLVCGWVCWCVCLGCADRPSAGPPSSPHFRSFSLSLWESCRGHTTARELQTCTLEGPGASKHHQNSTRKPQRKREIERK